LVTWVNIRFSRKALLRGLKRKCHKFNSYERVPCTCAHLFEKSYCLRIAFDRNFEGQVIILKLK